MAKVMIERDECSSLVGAYRKQGGVGSVAKVLIAHRHYVVSGFSQEVLATAAQVLVKLELHAGSVIGIRMIRSLVISAP